MTKEQSIRKYKVLGTRQKHVEKKHSKSVRGEMEGMGKEERAREGKINAVVGERNSELEKIFIARILREGTHRCR